MMLLRSGVRVDPLNLDLTKVTIQDIAWGLHHINRWGGQADPPITVAQHCIAGARWFASFDMWTEALAFLHHDDGEVFFGDMCHDLKREPQMAWFREQERKCSERLRLHFAPTTERVTAETIGRVDDMSYRAELVLHMGQPSPGGLPLYCFRGDDDHDTWLKMHRAYGGIG